jgi:hypothetical protein
MRVYALTRPRTRCQRPKTKRKVACVERRPGLSDPISDWQLRTAGAPPLIVPKELMSELSIKLFISTIFFSQMRGISSITTPCWRRGTGSRYIPSVAFITGNAFHQQMGSLTSRRPIHDMSIRVHQKKASMVSRRELMCTRLQQRPRFKLETQRGTSPTPSLVAKSDVRIVEVRITDANRQDHTVNHA